MPKKILTSLVLAASFSIASFASAQTSSTEELIRQIQAQINALLAQIQQLQQQTQPPASSETAKFLLNDGVIATANLRVRSSASVSGNSLSIIPQGTRGTITGGPVSANGYTWWNINWPIGSDGWSVENYLEKTTVPTQQLPETATIKARIWYDKDGDGIKDGYVSENGNCGLYLKNPTFFGFVTISRSSNNPSTNYSVNINECDNIGPFGKWSVDRMEDWSVSASLLLVKEWEVITQNPLVLTKAKLSDGFEEVEFGIRKIATPTTPSITGTPAFYKGPFVINSATCGEKYVFTVSGLPSYPAQVWLEQTKDGSSKYNDVITVPNTYTSACNQDEGTYSNTVYSVVNGQKGSLIGSTAVFKVNAAPSASTKPNISSVSPSQGSANSKITIYGTDLSGASSVEFYTSDGQFKGSLVPSSASSQYVNFTIDGIFAANMLPGKYQLGVVTNACAGGCSSNRIGFILEETKVITPTIKITSNSVSPGDKITISWSTSYTGSTSFYYEGVSGQSPIFIRSVNGTAGDFSWIVPTGISGNLRIRGANNYDGNFYSSTFSVSSPTVAAKPAFTFYPSNGSLTAGKDAWKFSLSNAVAGDTLNVTAFKDAGQGYVYQGRITVCTVQSGNTGCTASAIPSTTDAGTWMENVFRNGDNLGQIFFKVIAPTVTAPSFSFSHNNGNLVAGRDYWTFKLLNAKAGDRLNVTAFKDDNYLGRFDICTVPSGATSCSASAQAGVGDVGKWRENVLLNTSSGTETSLGEIIFTVTGTQSNAAYGGNFADTVRAMMGALEAMYKELNTLE